MDGLYVQSEARDSGGVPTAGEEGRRGKGILKNTTTTVGPKQDIHSRDRKTVSFHNKPAAEVDYIDERSSPPNEQRSFSPLPLCLVVAAHFSTPRIQLEPSLPAVHAHLREITSAMLAVLTRVTWWGGGGGGGRTLYDVFKVNGTVEAMQEDILQAIQSKLSTVNNLVPVCDGDRMDFI